MVINDEIIKCCKWKFRTKHLTLAFASFQLFMTLLSLAQHVYSIVVYNNILICHFKNESRTATSLEAKKIEGNYTHVGGFLQADLIIYDFGLYHELWGIRECIANYMDGGYMRFLWCIGYTSAICILFGSACFKHPPTLVMYPILIMQSCYCIGVMILTFSALPKLFRLLFGELDMKSFGQVTAYGLGTLMNFYLNYCVWHLYWHIGATNKKRKRAEAHVRSQGCILGDARFQEAEQHEAINMAFVDNNHNSTTTRQSTMDQDDSSKSEIV